MPYKDPEKNREYHQNYREKNRQKARDYARKYRINNIDTVKASSKKWRENNEQVYREKEREARYDELVMCEECGLRLAFISGKHLQKHNITIGDYKIKYPDAPIIINGLRESRGRGSTTKAKRNHYKGINPDRQLDEFLTGSLLGDGSLELPKINARYVEGSNNKKYMEWKHEFIEKYFYCNLDRRVSKIDKRTNKQYVGWFIKTSSYPYLTEIRKRWYTPKKQVPRDIVNKHLTPFSLAIWYFDDGHLSKSGVNLYTHGFDKGDVVWLSALLKKRFNIEFKITPAKKEQYYLRTTVSEIDKFIKIIEPHVAPGMEYKLTKGGDPNASRVPH